jgi:hypothetical protein
MAAATAATAAPACHCQSRRHHNDQGEAENHFQARIHG